MWRLTRLTLVLFICVKVCKSSKCLNPRIVGGKDASVGKWPWMVSLHNTTFQQHFCGGSLISSEWVMTAAHCVFGTPMSTILLYLGKMTQQGTNTHEITRTVVNIIIHPSYSSTTLDNDIALLHLSSAVANSNYIHPVSLADQNSMFSSGTKGWITGWGHIGVQINKDRRIKTYTVPVPLPAPGTLQEVEVEVYENNLCKFCLRAYITPNMICAGTLKGGRGHWEGDSGGPMVHEQCSVWVQSGIISGGNLCAQPDKPDLYTRVSKYQQWIESHTGQNTPVFVPFNPQTPCPPASKTG